MFDVDGLLRKYFQYIFFLFAIYLLLWGFTEYKIIFLSLMLGTAAGSLNLWLLARRTKKIGTGKGKVRSSGTFIRIGIVLLAAMLASKFPSYLSVIPVAAGVVVTYIVTMIAFAWHLRKRGEIV